MSIPGSASPLFLSAAAAAAPSAFQIDRSLRFNDDDSAYLNRDLSSGSTTTWTFSAWVKKTLITTSTDYRGIFTARSAADNYAYLDFSNNGIRFANRPPSGTVAVLQTTPVFRDASAWFHVVFVYDSSNATSTDTLRLYINGTRVTAFSTATYPSASQASIINSGIAHYIGYDSQNTAFMDGYLADVHFIDGVSGLTASDFGEYDSNNVWQPKEYSGTYGTNGFHLDFSDNSSNESLGYDQKETVTLNPKGGFDVVTYTGNGSTQVISNSNFQPDFVWIKNRSSDRNHYVYDVIRGAGTAGDLAPNTTDAEDSLDTGVYGYLSSFNSNGFTVVDGTNSTGNFNSSGQNYVAWCWKAGGAPVSNTDGTITSSVSANTDYGFSIVSYTGTGATGGTVGHGLSSAPKFIVIKNRDRSIVWVCYHSGIGSGSYLQLNSNAGKVDDATYWGSGISSTTFGLQANNASGINYLNEDHIAYCWSEVSGFSKFGSYSGSGASGNAITGFGFKPRWILIKNSGSTENWFLYDTERGPESANNDVLRPNLSNPELQSSETIDFDSDGFTLNTSDTALNASGNNYVYVAFANRPGNDWDVNNLVADGGVVYSNYVSGYLNSLNSSYAVTNLFDGSTSTFVLSNSTSGSGIKFVPPTDITGSIELYLRNGDTANSTFSYSLDNGSTFTNLTTTSAGSYVSIGSQTISNTNGIIVRHVTTAGTNSVNWRAIRVDGTVLTDGTPSNTDSLIDTPTNYEAASGNNGGNYATLNPLAAGFGSNNQAGTLSNGNLDWTTTSTTYFANAVSTIAPKSGKYYVETICQNVLYSGIGFANAASINDITGNFGLGAPSDGWFRQGTVVNNNSSNLVTSLPALAVGDVVGLALDLDNGKAWWSQNGVWHSSGDPASGTNATVTFTPGDKNWLIGLSLISPSSNQSVNFGQRQFAYTPPTGYLSLCTQNLTDPTIADGSTAMDVVTYTGNGTTRSITSLNFSPDLLWFKTRNTSREHYVYDIVRGVQRPIYPDLSNQAETGPDTDAVSSFDSNGWTMGGDSGGNNNNDTYVCWTWDGGTSTVSNTDGSITSSVRANASAGFSIVSYTGNATTGTTVGHGLNAAPEFIIIKNRDQTYDWYVFGNAIDSTFDQRLTLNSTAAKTSSTSAMDATAPTSSVFTVGNNPGTNGNGDDQIAYCFAPVEGYSAFGSFEGTDTDPGPFVYLGFRPALIILKNADATQDWVIYDSTRSTYNEAFEHLHPNTSGAENSTANDNSIDILSNGFRPMGATTSNDATNGPSQTILYAAWAEHPFKTARAR